MIMNNNSKLTVLPLMLCFFAMGFVDLVGIASNYGHSCYPSLEKPSP